MTRIDGLLLGLYVGLVVFGWFNIHSVSCEKKLHQGLFDFSNSAGKQLIWVLIAWSIFFLILLSDSRTYQSMAYVFYAFVILLLLATLLFGVSVGEHKAWLGWGRGQPSELAKLACALAIANFLDKPGPNLHGIKSQLVLLGIVLLPTVLIFLQGDWGSGLVFTAFFIVFYLEDLFSWVFYMGTAVLVIVVFTLFLPRVYLVVGTISLSFLFIGLVRNSLRRVVLVILLTLGALVLVEGSHILFEKGLKPYQKSRVKVLVDPSTDPLGVGWNVTQSKIAIGSGGLWGKGFLQGTQTKYGFIPRQSTDFIFCTIGEEYGWVGSSLFICAFVALLWRILYLARRQNLRFAQVYGYSVASVIFFHFMINVGMTLGLMPVIGIPLPFVSYGGSALCSFSLMLFLLLKLDAERKNYTSWRETSLLD